MTRIVEPTVTTPQWHGTANLIATIVALSVLTVMALSAALVAASIDAAVLAGVAGMSAIALAVVNKPHAIAAIDAR